MLVGATLLLATGCGGNDSKADKPATKASGKTSAAKATAGADAAPAFTREKLESTALKNGDVAGWEITVPKSASGPIGVRRMTADKAACQPIADALSETGAVERAAAAERSAVAKDASGVMVRVRLASYADGGAEKVMTAMADAAADCTGFTATAGDEKQHVGVAQYNGYLTAQSSVALRLTTKVGRQTLPVYLDVGRVGSTVEYFMTLNVLGDDPGTGSTTVQVQQNVRLAAAH